MFARNALRAGRRLHIALARRIHPTAFRCVAPGIAPSPAGVRFASSADPSNPQEQRIQELVEKLNLRPDIKELLADFQGLLEKKGFNVEKPPLMLEVMGLFAQKDVRTLILKLKVKFEEAGIRVTPEDMNLFTGLFKK